MSIKEKKVVAEIKVKAPAGAAKPTPALGSSLGPKGVNIMQFCKEFNEQTKSKVSGTMLPVTIRVHEDKSFMLVIKEPSVSDSLKKEAGLSKGASIIGRGKFIGSISAEQVRQIAKSKMTDMNCYDEEAAVRMVVGTAQSMGLKFLD